MKDNILIFIPFIGFFLGAITIGMFDSLISSALGSIALMFTWISIVYFCVLLIIFRKLQGKFLLQFVTGLMIPFIFMVLINYI